jgi:hypothetical protein
MRKSLLAIGVLCVVWTQAASAAYADEVLADNPIAYYRFEETAGAVAVDASANSNDGIYANGVLLNQPGAAALGRAARFDGIDDYVDTPRTVSTDFTLELWVNTTDPGLSGGQAYEGNGLLWSDVGGGANDFVLAMLNGALSFFTGNPDTTVTSATAINDGAWHHLVATRTLGGNVEIFIDGVSRGVTTTNGSALDANPSIMIGANVLDGRYFAGLIDEVAYYPTVLSPARINAHYRAAFASSNATAIAVPTLGEWALIALVAGIALAGGLSARTRVSRTRG